MKNYALLAALTLFFALSGCQTRTWTATEKCTHWYYIDIELAGFDSTDIDTLVIRTYYDDSTRQSTSSALFARIGNKYKTVNNDISLSWSLYSYDTVFSSRYKLMLELYSTSVVPGENLEIGWPSIGKKVLITSLQPDGEEQIQYKADPYTEPKQCYRYLKSYQVEGQLKTGTLLIEK